MFLLRKYGTGTGADVRIPMVKRGVVDLAVGADWTPAAGDVKISIDGAAAASITTLPTALTMGNTALWVFTFSNAELRGKEIVVTVCDLSSPKVVEDQAFIIETYGHASAKFPDDLGVTTASRVWDELLTGATHNIANSAGKDLRTIAPTVSEVLRTGTAQAGGASTITLDAGASAADNAYQYDIVSIISGTGAGQSKWIASYVGATKVATVNSAWTVQPDNTSVFEVTPTSVAQVISYASGQSPLQPTVAGRTLDVAATGEAGLDFSNVKDGNLDETLVGATIMGALNGARAQAFGKWTLIGTTLRLYASDGVTVLKSFTLDSATVPTIRT